MAIIGKIRKHSALAVILVGVAITAFIVSDLFTGRGRGGRKRSIPEVGRIENVEITSMEFNRRVEENLEIQRTNQNKDNLTAQETFDVRNNTWNQFLNEVIMGNEYDELGLKVTTDELFDLVQGQHPHRLIMQYFTDPNTGQYSPQIVMNFLQNLDKLEPKVKTQWLNLEKYIKEDRLTQKYQTLVAKGYYIPEAFARMDFDAKKKNAELRYVAIRYTSIPDGDVPVSDKDYEAYYEKNKKMYEQEASRDIDYIIFDVQASAEDRAEARESAYKIYDDFKDAIDIPTFVNSISDQRYDSTWHKKGSIQPVKIDSIAFNSPMGTFIPPFEDGGAWYMAKVLDMQNRPDSMKAEHILIAYQGAMRAGENVTRTKEQAQKTADSLFTIIKADNSQLQALAMMMSDDGSAKNNHGDLGWFADGSMVGPFNEAVLKAKVGDLIITETVFGYHIIKVTGKKDPTPKVRVAVVKRNIEPSSKTFQDVYVQASTFAGENSTREKFDKTVSDQGLNKRNATYLREMANNIPGIDNPREIIRWAFTKGIEVGNVSPVFDVGGAYVVAVLTVVREKGITPLDQLKDNIKNFVYNEKKAATIQEKLNGSSTDIYQIARDFNSKVDTNLTMTFASRNIPGFGAEYTVIGETFTIQEGNQSEGIQGNAGVFVVKVDKYFEPQAPANYNQNKDQMYAQFRQRVQSNYMFTALQKKADIKDERLLFY